MNWNERQRRFSLRKLKVGVASVVVGLLGFVAASPTATAQAQVQPVVNTQSKAQLDLNYRYVQESELTAQEQAQILSQLPLKELCVDGTYYMVYRPVGHLPQTNSEADNLLPFLGAGLLLIGLTTSKSKKKRLITSLFILSLGDVMSVAALPVTSNLSAYDKSYRLQVGSPLPATVIDIPNHEFVGYLLVQDQDSACYLPASHTPSRQTANQSPVSRPTQASQMNRTSQATSASAHASSPSQKTARPVPASQSSRLSSNGSASARASQSTTSSQSIQLSSSHLGSVSAKVSSSTAPVSHSLVMSRSAKGSSSSLTSVSVKVSTSASPASQSRVMSQSVKPSVSSSTSVSAQVSTSQSRVVSQSAQASASQSASVSAQASVSASLASQSRVISQSPKPSVSSSTSVSASQSVSLSQSVQPSVSSSTSVAQSVVASVSQSASVSAQPSTSQAPSELASQSLSTSVVNSVAVPPTPSQAPKPVTPVEKIELESLAFETIYKEDPTLPLGSEMMLQEGVPGQKRKRYVDGVLVAEEIVTQPVNRIIVRGSKKANIPAPKDPVVTEEVEAIAFATDYREDPTLPLGSETVIQEGVLGQKHKRYVDGVLVAEEIVTQPVNRIVARGSKKADTPAPKDPVVTEEVEAIAFATDYREDPTLPLGSETVIQEGVLGQKRKRYIDGVLVVEEIVTQPVNRIVARGTKPATPDQPVSQPVVTTEAIPFETESIEDDTLPLGQEVVVQVGVPGVREVKTLDGQVVASQVIQAPVKQIIKRGTKVVVPDQPVSQPVVTTEPIPFETESIEDASLPLGQEVVVQAGVPGVREIKTLDGQVVSSQVIQAPVKQIIKRGTKVAPVTETRQLALPFETLYQDDASLPEGQEEVIQNGQPGLAEQTWENGQLVAEKIVTQPVNRIIKRGSKKATPTEGTEVETSTAPIAPEVIRENDDSLWLGETQETPGTEGEKTITTTYITLDGVRQPNPTVTEEVTRPATPTLIKVGTKPVEGTETETETVEIDFKTVEELDDSKYTDEEVVRVEGEKGSKTVTATYETIKGVRQPNPTVSEAMTKEAVDRVVVKGTKPIEGETTVTELETIAFKEEIQLDPTKLASEPDELVQEGREGSKTITKVYKTVRGQQVGDPISQTEAVSLEAQDRIIKRGTRVLTEAEKQTPVVKAVKQEVGLNVTPNPEASIETSTLTNVASYTWKDGVVPVTSASGDNIPGLVRVTYIDGSYDDVPVSILVRSEADKQTPSPTVQTVNLGATPDASKSIEAGLPAGTTYAWKTGHEPSTTTSSPSVAGIVVVTYADGSSEEVAVTIKVESDADRQTPTAVVQTVNLKSDPDASKSIEAGLPNAVSYVWKDGAKPSTDTSGESIPGTVIVTYADGSSEEVAVTIKVESDADRQTPSPIVQTVNLGATPDASRSIADGLPAGTTYAWKTGHEPSTTASSSSVAGTVIVTYADGSSEEVAVTIKVESDADRQTPSPTVQTVNLGSTPDASKSIEAGLPAGTTYAWKAGHEPLTSASSPSVAGTVIVTYADGSSEEVVVTIKVESDADRQTPEPVVQKVNLGVDPVAASSIAPGLPNAVSYAWKEGAKPSTVASGESIPGTVIVTYADGSSEEVAVTIKVESDADRQTPEPVVQKVNLGATPDASKSIEAGLPAGTTYAWKTGHEPSTTASSPSVTGTVIVTYADGSSEEVAVTIKVESDADRQTPSPIVQTVNLGADPDASKSIEPGLPAGTTYAWKTGHEPSTTASSPSVTGTVIVTYADGSSEEVAVTIKVESDADRQTPTPTVQTVNLGSTPDASKSIEAGLPNVVSYAWKDGAKPSTATSGENIPGTVIVTYADGSSEEVAVTIKVESDADRGQPSPRAVQQEVKVGQMPDAAASIDPSNLANVSGYSWKPGRTPDTTQPTQDVAGTVIVTYNDGSTDEVEVTIDVLPNKTKPTLELESLVEHDDEKKITLDYKLTDPTSAKTAVTYEIYSGSTLVKSGTVTDDQPFDVTGLDWFTPYTLKTTLKYDLGNGEQTELLEDKPFELNYKKVEIRHVEAVELYEKQTDGSYRKVDKLTAAPTDLTNYYAKVIDDKHKDLYLAVTAVTEGTAAGKPTFTFTATAPELIEHQSATRENVPNYTFDVLKFQASEGNKLRNFADLVTAISRDLTGTYEIDDDLDATDFALGNGALSYIGGNFTGKLLGNNHAIKGLKAPLFNQLQGGFVVQDLDLKQVNINVTREAVGALANHAIGQAGVSKISNVAVEGNIRADRQIGGLVYQVRNTILENVAFTGQISTITNWNYNFTGGLVGYLRDNSIIDKAKVDVTVTVNAISNPQIAHVGSVVGVAETNNPNVAGGNIKNIEANGQVINQTNSTSHIGGVLGSANANIRLRNVVSSVDVTNGKSIIGTPNNLANNVDASVVLVEGTTSTKDNNAPTTKSADDAQAQVDAMGITVTLADTVRQDINKYDVDYSQVKGYQEANRLKYENTEKLLPFYNKEFIIKQGNLITSGNLATKKVVAVVPMINNQVVADYASHKAAINKLMVHYEDGSVEYLDIAFKENFKETGIAEYRIGNTDLLYTPNQLTTNYQSVAQAVQADLASLDYYDPAILTKLNKPLGSETVQDLMDKLYLKESFNEVKADLAEILPAVLATSNVLATPNQDLASYIKANKEELMIGLAYVNRWYNLNFGEFNAKDLILYHQDFFGKPVDTLEWLIGLAKGGYNNVRAHNNVTTYTRDFAKNSDQSSLFDYLSAFRQKLTTYQTDAEWFKATTKAYIVETKSEERPDLDVSAYNRMIKYAGQQNGILPLLTAQEGIYILSNMTTISYGMFDRYFDMGLKTSDPATYATELARVKALADEAGALQGTYFDTWYRLNPNGQQALLDSLTPVWDAYDNSKRTYLKRWGSVDTNQAIQDFFGPILPDITATTNEQRRGYHQKISGGSSGIAYGDYVTYMLNFRLLEKNGLSIFTHENIHNMEGKFYMGGFDRRLGIMPEFYPLGVLQSPENGVASNSIFAFNTMFDFTDNVNDTNRYVNVSPDRFQSQADLQEYLHGSFDVLYLMDYAEASAILSKDDATKQKFWAKIENTYVANSGITNAFAVNKLRPLTAEEVASLKTLDDLIDQSVLTRRETYTRSTEQVLERNGYFRVGMFSPIYSALSNPDGSPGDLMFKRMAFELLAAKGYDNGFLPYASNQLGTQAAAEGRYGTDPWWFNRQMPFPTDKMVFDHIFGNDYADWNAFKKAMFQERIAKKNQLKAVTINYLGSDVTINNFTDLQNLMNEAVTYDANNNVAANNSASRVRLLKGLIYNAYLRQSNDFRQSIFN